MLARLRRFLLWFVTAAAVGIAGAAAFLLAVFPRQAPPAPLRVELAAERVARGQYLAEHVILCTECHSDRDWSRLGAPAMAPLGAGRTECLSSASDMAGMNARFPGSLCFANITPDVETGVGAWSDGELIRAFREGVNRRGEALFPTMPYFIFRHLSDADAESVVAWMRSLAPVRHELPDKEVNFPVNLLIRFGPMPLEAPVAAPDRSDEVGYGRYLATIGRCIFCHTPQEGAARQPVPGRLLAGGAEFRGPFGIRRSPNLTPHETGLGGWSRADFIARFRRPVGAAVTPAENTLMAWSSYSELTDGDLGALYAYLRSVPAVENAADQPGGR